MADPLPAEANTMWLVTGGRTMKTPMGVFTTQEKANAWVEAGNEWYGAGHPLVPLRAEPVKVDTRPFPATEMRAVRDDGNSDAALRRLFDTL